MTDTDTDRQTDRGPWLVPRMHSIARLWVRGHCACAESRDLWVGGQKQLHFWNARLRFAYSLYNFYWATTTLVLIRAQQIQDGGRPPFWKKKPIKSPYLCNLVQCCCNLACWLILTRFSAATVNISNVWKSRKVASAVATLSGNSLRQTVHTICLCSPISKTCRSPLKGGGGNCKPGGK